MEPNARDSKEVTQRASVESKIGEAQRRQGYAAAPVRQEVGRPAEGKNGTPTRWRSHRRWRRGRRGTGSTAVAPTVAAGSRLRCVADGWAARQWNWRAHGHNAATGMAQGHLGRPRKSRGGGGGRAPRWRRSRKEVGEGGGGPGTCFDVLGWAPGFTRGEIERWAAATGLGGERGLRRWGPPGQRDRGGVKGMGGCSVLLL